MRLGAINDAFVTGASKLSFQIALPALLFSSIIQTDLDPGRNLSLVLYGVCATAVIYLTMELIVPYLVPSRADRGVVVQGSFRSNMGIIGLAYCVNAFGDASFDTAAIYLAIVTIFYNIFSVFTLNRWQLSENNTQLMLKNVALGILKNPIVLSIFAAIGINLFQVQLPKAIVTSASYLSQMALPLALLCAGASLSFKVRGDLTPAIVASVLRLLVFPLLFTVVACLFGFKGMDLGILFLMSSAPTAAASYTMVRAMNGNSTLAANIIALTTLFSFFTTAVGIAILKGLELS
jgi:predicted permease